MSTIYEVTGMTCAHCQAAVQAEVGAVPGVTGVQVDVTTGRVEVHGDADAAAVRAAIKEAGYATA